MVKKKELGKLFSFLLCSYTHYSNLPVFHYSGLLLLDDDSLLDRLDDIIGVIGQVKNIEVIG